jgi:hypothetical protein
MDDERGDAARRHRVTEYVGCHGGNRGALLRAAEVWMIDGTAAPVTRRAL